MAESISFTQARVRALQYSRTDAQPDFVWDSDQVGLGVRITAAGIKSFVLRYRVLGRQRLKTLGRTGTHSVDDARIWARAGLSAADKNEDFQRAEERERALGTVAQLWADFIADRPKGRTVDDMQSLWRTHLEPTFGAKRLTEVTASDVRAWHRRASEPRQVTVRLKSGKERVKTVGGTYAANRALQWLRAAFNWRKGEWPAGFVNPCIGISVNAERPRGVILRPDELPRLAKAIEAYPDIYARALVWLALYTGGRRNELLKLRWTDVDLDGARLTFKDTKNRTDRPVPLAPDAVKLLERLPRIERNPFVFPGLKGDRHRVGVRAAWAAMRKAAGLPDLHLHDLRRSVGSWLGAAGHTAPMIGELLGHKSDVTSRVYIKLGELGVKQQLVTAHAGLLRGALGKTPKKRKTGRPSKKGR